MSFTLNAAGISRKENALSKQADRCFIQCEPFATSREAPNWPSFIYSLWPRRSIEKTSVGF